MSLYAIADLHLSLGVDKPMDIFGDNWENHHEKIKENWEKNITKEDTILLLRRFFMGYAARRNRQRLPIFERLAWKKNIIKRKP